MKCERHYLFIFLLGIFSVSASVFFVLPAHGAIEPPYKSIEYCYRIDNISAFPDFVVFARIPAAFGGEITDPVQLKESECYARNTRDEIVAVRRELFRASESVYRDVELKDSVSNSGIRTPVSPVKIYDLQDPRKKIEDIFTIDALDDQIFSLRLAKKIVERNNGTVEEKVYATAEEGLADPPGPGYEYTDAPITIVENPNKADHVWYQKNWVKGLLALGLLGVFGIIAWLSSRKRKRL